jgi:ankyrin repeat protein
LWRLVSKQAGETPLMVAAEFAKLDVVQCLIQAGAGHGKQDKVLLSL